MKQLSHLVLCASFLFGSIPAYAANDVSFVDRMTNQAIEHTAIATLLYPFIRDLSSQVIGYYGDAPWSVLHSDYLYRHDLVGHYLAGVLPSAGATAVTVLLGGYMIKHLIKNGVNAFNA